VAWRISIPVGHSRESGRAKKLTPPTGTDGSTSHEDGNSGDKGNTVSKALTALLSIRAEQTAVFEPRRGGTGQMLFLSKWGRDGIWKQERALKNRALFNRALS